MQRIVCLANSRKNSGRCVAGKEFPAPGKWVRIISSRPTAELSEPEIQYKGGMIPELLDVIDIPVRAPVPHSFQTENVEVDPSRAWAKAGTFPQANLRTLLDSPADLWLTNGPGDRVLLEQASAFGYSLRFIQADAVALSVRTEGVARWQVRATFDLEGTSYHLPVTDPEMERRTFAQPDLALNLGLSFLTISLGEPFHNHCYKLVAAIIPVSL